MKTFLEKALSRKLWAMIATCAGIYAVEGRAGLWKIVTVVSTYIGGQAAVDVSANFRSKNPQ